MHDRFTVHRSTSLGWGLVLAMASILGCSDSQGQPSPPAADDSSGGTSNSNLNNWAGGSSGDSGGTSAGDGGAAAGIGGGPVDTGTGGTESGTGGSDTSGTGGAPPGAGTTPCDPEAIVVDSLAALLPYLDDNDVSVQLAPGTYRIDSAVVDELFPQTPLLEVTGNNSTYCFTGATIEFETEIFQDFGNVGVVELSVTGSNNVLRNLTMVDLGDTRPTRTALGIQVDGEENLIEGFHLTVRGSEPYAYGDHFGKGSGYVIKHFKHSAILLTGTNLHLKDITIIHRAYGHGIFMQGAIGVLIEGIYMEGELRTTDEILAEQGTSAAAVDFQTVWGFPVKPGYRFSLQEDGIRAYRNAANGRIASDITVRDSIVKFMRSGVTIGLGESPQYVENVTALGTEAGFWVGGGGGQIVNCRGDASVGPLYQEGNPKNGNNIDLTLLDSVVPKLGDTPAVYLAGNNHDLILKDGTTTFDPNLEIHVGGVRLGHRWNGEQTNATNMTVENQTDYPVVLGANSSDNEVTSCGATTDYGSDNDVSEVSCQ